MASETAHKLAAMSIAADAQTVSHGPCSNMGEWRSQLETVKGLPESYALTKTLVFKPSMQFPFTSTHDICIQIREPTLAYNGF